jgi:hypothetical protein
MNTTMRWFRFYNEALEDPKVQKLSGDQFKAWVNLLCLASKNDGLIRSASDAAFGLRITDSKAMEIISILAARGLLDRVEGGSFTPHNWSERQYKSDTSNERMKRLRERRRSGDVTSTVTGDVTSTVTTTSPVTPPESDSDSDSDSEQKVGRGRRGSRLPADWAPTSGDIAFAEQHGLQRHEIDIEATKFRNYYLSTIGKGAARLDWSRTWQNWVLNGYGTSRKQNSKPTVHDRARDADEHLSRVAAEFLAAGHQGHEETPRMLPTG